MVATRAEEPFPSGSLDGLHYQSLHRHLFQDIYAWSGAYRTVRISKRESMFCYPEHIASEMEHLFAWLESRNGLAGLGAHEFGLDAARVLATLNAIQPFREGNGRTQLAFMAVLADRAGHPLALERLQPDAFLSVMIRSFAGDEAPLARQLESLIAADFP